MVEAQVHYEVIDKRTKSAFLVDDGLKALQLKEQFGKKIEINMVEIFVKRTPIKIIG